MNKGSWHQAYHPLVENIKGGADYYELTNAGISVLDYFTAQAMISFIPFLNQLQNDETLAKRAKDVAKETLTVLGYTE